MRLSNLGARWLAILAIMLGLSAPWASPMAADQRLTIKPVAERKLKQLPAGPLYWNLENFATRAQAEAAAGPTSLVAEVAGKVWLFTLGAKDDKGAGGSHVVQIGPIPQIAAPEYLLRINHASGPPGAKTDAHSHPGSEAFYVLAGRLGQKTPSGVTYAEAGQAMTGHGADVPMVVFSAGASNLDQLVMFVVDATRPFSAHAKLD